MCLQSPRRALIDGLSAWMCQTGKITYRSHKQYLYWLSWLEFAFVRKISFPLSITNKQTRCILLIFFSLKVKTFKLWNILTIKEGPMLVLTLIKCLSPLYSWISFICNFGSIFFLVTFMTFCLLLKHNPVRLFRKLWNWRACTGSRLHLFRVGGRA